MNTAILSVKDFTNTLKPGDIFWYLQDDLRGVLKRVAGPYTLLQYKLNMRSLRPTALCRAPVGNKINDLYDSLLVRDPFESKDGEVEFYIDLLVDKQRVVFLSKKDAECYIQEYREACRTDQNFLKKVAEYAKQQEDAHEREYQRIISEF